MRWKLTIKDYIHHIRPLPNKLFFKKELIFSVGIVVLGLLLGTIAKMTDSISVIGEIGTELGVWVFLATLIAVYSRYPVSAAVNVLVFFLSMLCSYYLYGQFILGFFPSAYFMGWLIIALLSPIAGFFIWFSKGRGMPSILIAALPISLLFSLGYPAFYTYDITLILTLLFGAVLTIILSKTAKQRIILFCISILFAVLIVYFRLVNYLPF